MKTTFKTVFNEMDDELMNLDTQENAPVDIDIDKIKSEVFMEINDDNKKKKSRKKLIVILAAAVLLIGGTVGAFATGSVQQIFGSIFHNGNQMNELGLFDGGNVEVSSADSSLDVKLLGIIGDGEKLCSAIEITKKDGSPVIDKDYTYPGINEPYNGSSWKYTLTVNGKSKNAMQSPQYVLSDGNKTLTIYLFTTTASGQDCSLQNGRMTFVSKQFHVNKVTNELASVKLSGRMDPIFDKIKNSEELTADDVLFDQEELAKKRNKLGLNEEDFTTIDYKGTRIYCQAELKAFKLPFTISYDLNYRTDQFIEKDLSAQTAPEIVVKNTRNARMTVSPFSIYLSGECDADNPDSSAEYGSDKCFLLPKWDDTSKVTLKDGTVYYLYANEGGEHREDENGVYHTTVHLQYSRVIGPPLQPENIFVNIKEIKSVTINGDTIYQAK